ncbi:hypothetical protein [uncultured Cohaesibacter sp.]|uniref:hypothetical protein n=1 Tax=uncultured Cohaesibacter sp. TaxID=1002546 RepID=UPI0029C905BE|nr:hypothetical protein [uncultured Cohaesibacter sp.]
MCNCIETVNKQLAERNTVLSQAIFMHEDPNPGLTLRTEQVETGRGKPKAVSMFLNFCPFCGEKYHTKEEQAA